MDRQAGVIKGLFQGVSEIPYRKDSTPTVREVVKLGNYDEEFQDFIYGHDPLKIKLGEPTEGWVSVDVVTGSDVQTKNLSILRFLKTESVDSFWAENVLPRFLYREITAVLDEWHRVLKPGGTIIIECPDLEAVCKEFLAGNDIDRYLTIDPIIWAFYGTQVKKSFKRTVFGCGVTKGYLRHALECTGFEDFEFEDGEKKYYRSFKIIAKKKK